MAKVKTQTHDTFIDMTAMSDVTVLLLTFFMLTANFIPVEPVQVTAPSSVLETKIPDYNVATVLVDTEGRVFFNLDRPEDKIRLLEKMGERYGVTFSEDEKELFSQPATFAGVPVGRMKEYLSGTSPSARKDPAEEPEGIPVEEGNNQLAAWLLYAREVNQDLEISVKADRQTPYPYIRNVTSTLQDVRENRFNLVTLLRGVPEGF